MDLFSYWKAVTSKNSAEKCIRGITGEKNKYTTNCVHTAHGRTQKICCLDYDFHSVIHACVSG